MPSLYRMQTMDSIADYPGPTPAGGVLPLPMC